MIAQWITGDFILGPAIGETRPVARYRGGVIWCPFCDRSLQDTMTPLICSSCNALFKDDPPEAPTEPPPTRRRRRTGEAPPADAEPADPEPV